MIDIRVANQWDLRSALFQAFNVPVHIILDRDIYCQGMLLEARDPDFRYLSQENIKISGEGHTLDFGNAFDGDWSEVPVQHDRWTNGITFNAPAVTIQDVKFEHYNSFGRALYFIGYSDILITGCTFTDIASASFTPREWPTDIATDTLYTQVIGAHLPQGTITISNCTFDRCALGNLWNHCVYTRGEYCNIFQCTFKNSGQPLTIGPKHIANVLDNRFLDLRPVPVYQTHYKVPWLLGLREDFSVYIQNNTVDSAVCRLWNWNASGPTQIHTRRNNYSGLRFTEEQGQKEFYLWLSRGYDRDCTMPQKGGE